VVGPADGEVLGVVQAVESVARLLEPLHLGRHAHPPMLQLGHQEGGGVVVVLGEAGGDLKGQRGGLLGQRGRRCAGDGHQSSLHMFRVVRTSALLGMSCSHAGIPATGSAKE
jgi:hypothetical protein